MKKTRRKPAQHELAPSSSSHLDLAIRIGLILVTLALYTQVSHFDFVSYDDPEYVSDNAQVQAGLTPASIRWAFTSATVSHWAPVTMLSHILTYQLFGADSGMHHLVSALLHALAALLLLASLQRATGARWPSVFVALVFALHPLHVESAAWIAERKDVLSAFFWFLALYAYVRHAERPSLRGYLLVMAPFCLGLMSKSMMVTFPFALLLFDLWPLRRLQFPRILWEKLPMIALSAALSALTFSVQSAQSASEAMVRIPLALRIQESSILYVAYIGRALWPAGLAVIYPTPQPPAAWQVAAAVVVLASISTLAIYTWRSRPYIAVGWFWYLGTLFPVVGLLVQVLSQGADRYTYIPMVGLTMTFAWGAADVLKQWPQTKPAIITAFAAVCLVCLALSYAQIGYWHDSGTLFQHAVDVTDDNFVAQYNLGNYLMRTRHAPEAIVHLTEALRLKPDYAEAHNNLGIQLASLPGRNADALSQFETAVRLRPDLAGAQFNLGVALAHVPGKTAEAVIHLEAAQRIQPNARIPEIIHRLQTAP